MTQTLVACALLAAASAGCTEEPAPTPTTTDSGPVDEPDTTPLDTAPLTTPDVPDVPDTSAPPEPQVCELGSPAPLPVPVGSNPGAASPFEKADNPNEILGALQDPTALQPTTAVWAPDYGVDLAAATFDVHVPPGYDGSAPYGLIAFINAGDNGGKPPNHLLPLLEEQRLLWVAPDKVGNSVYSVIRMGWTHMAVLRMKELFNVDPARIFAMGKSGGARHANLMMFQHPETYSAVLAWCGAHYFQEVEQAFETKEPDGHYEFWAPQFIPSTPTNFADHIAGFGQRFSLMTSDGDFREGDLMNIYHFGYLTDGLPARFLDTAGGHCVQNADHMRSAVAFADHPLHVRVDDPFDADKPNAGAGYITRDGEPVRADGVLALTAPAAITARDRIVWNDRFGATIHTRVDRGDDDTGTAVLELLQLNEAAAGLIVTIDGNLRVATTDGVTLLDAELTEPGSLGLTIDLWDTELHVVTDQALTGTTLLNDKRTAIVRWKEAGVQWAAAPEGSALTLRATEGTARFQHLKVLDGTGLSCP